MRLLELTLETPAENLALDEALLDEAEACVAAANVDEREEDDELLRIWESPQQAVILGRSSPPLQEVQYQACQALGVPVLRRSSGGATVMIGPGCLMYAVVLSYRRHPQLKMIEQAHQFVLERLRGALVSLLPDIEVAGTSDLIWQGRKFSGNFPLERVALCLGTPVRQPEYRAGRSHLDFLTNLPVTAHSLREALCRTWQADLRQRTWPQERTAALLQTRYVAWTP
jgi:lipoate-protein ligase A